MKKINIKLQGKTKKYTVFIGSSTTSLLKEFLEKNHKGKRIVVVTDDNIKNLCNEKIIRELLELNPHLISIPTGERSKSRASKEILEDELLENKFGRNTIIIAVGGGVIGDLAGFTASTYNRGIPIIHVPTTLLAMVDSSIGGKTSVNTSRGKNLIGTIYTPAAVFTDLNFLETLPEEEFINGMAEIIKIASTSDKKLFSFIEKNSKKIIEKNKDALLRIIKRSIELKKEVVEKDENEIGLRQMLNFGHTFGHAIEAYSKYKIKHGCCVSLGIAVESKISALTGNLKDEESEKIVSLLKKFSLPTIMDKNIDSEKIIEIMEIDKKSKNQKPRFVILEKIGRIKTGKDAFSFEVNESIIKKSIELCKND